MDFLAKVDTIAPDALYGAKWGHLVQKPKKIIISVILPFQAYIIPLKGIKLWQFNRFICLLFDYGGYQCTWCPIWCKIGSFGDLLPKPRKLIFPRYLHSIYTLYYQASNYGNSIKSVDLDGYHRTWCPIWFKIGPFGAKILKNNYFRDISISSIYNIIPI